MAGFSAAGELNRPQGIAFSEASESDDAGIRRLLRDNPMAGRICLTFQREPDCFLEARHAGSSHRTIIARQNGKIVCVGGCSFQMRFINGHAHRTGYLSGLRLDASVAGRQDILRRGYARFWEGCGSDDAACYFTSIASDNRRALRFLERDIRGMARYEFVGEFVTVLISVSGEQKRSAAEIPRAGDLCDMAELLGRHGHRHQFVPCWTARAIARLEPLGLGLGDFRIIRSGSGIAACAALWDQRSFKQTIVQGYTSSIAWGRRIFNVAARMTGRPRLPAPGSVLAHAAVSHLGMESDDPLLLEGLVESLRSFAARRGLDCLSMGFSAEDARLEAIRRRFRCHEYRSRLYQVIPSKVNAMAVRLDARLPLPEIALL
jgi:hypothetical protein